MIINRSGRHNLLRLILLFVVLVGLVGVVWFGFTLIPKTINSSSTGVVTVQKTAQPVAVSSNILFSGNTYWGRYINDWSMASPLKYAYPFSRLNEFDRSRYDAWISGLECPTVAGASQTSAQEDATLQFNCSPNYLSEAAKWFTAFTLANNHTDNQGEAGFSETKTQLDKNGIQYFGHYDPRVVDDICEVIAMPVTITMDNNTATHGKLPMAMCGYEAVFRLPLPEAVAKMQKYSQYMPVIAMPHMGTEYKSAPDQLKIDFYRSLIDGGADMILGDHPHWIQSSEAYKGHLIVYSMGNFMFDQQDTSEVVRSAAINVVLSSTNQDSVQLKKWLAIGDQCGVFKDACLDQIVAQGLTKLDLGYKFGVVGTDDSGKITKPATTSQQNSILQRLNWQTTVNNLQAPYSSL